MKLFLLSALAWLFLFVGIDIYAPKNKTKDIHLGTSDLVITVNKDFTKRDEITQEYADDYLIAYYASDKKEMDFDVYQWAACENYSWEEEYAYTIAGVDGYSDKISIYNGVTVGTWISTQDFWGKTYKVINMFAEDSNGYYIEIQFWTTNKTQENLAWDMIKSVKEVPKTADQIKGNISLGNTEYYLKTEKSVTKMPLYEADIIEYTTEYYRLNYVDIDISVSIQGKRCDLPFEDYAKELADLLKEKDYIISPITVGKTTINGIDMLTTNCKEKSGDDEYVRDTYIMEAKDCVLFVVIWHLDGEEAEADALINSIIK